MPRPKGDLTGEREVRNERKLGSFSRSLHKFSVHSEISLVAITVWEKRVSLERTGSGHGVLNAVLVSSKRNVVGEKFASSVQ